MLSPLILLAGGIVSTQAASLTRIPTSQPPHAAPLPKDFVGISIESAVVDEWAGLTQPNPFVNQALNNLAALTGVATPVRVGGTPQDYTYLVNDGSLDAKVINATFPPATSSNFYPAADVVYVSPKVYELSGHFPKGTKLTWGLNFRDLNETELVRQAKAAASACAAFDKSSTKDVILERLELGNEPDFYSISFNPAAAPKYKEFNIFNNNGNYTKMANSIMSSVQGKKPSLLYGSFAQYGTAWTWNAANALGTGAPWTEPVAKQISAYSQHHYFGAFTGVATSPGPGYLLNRDHIRGNVSELAESVTQLKPYGLPVIMGETNSAARHGIPGVSDTAEAAIWLVDYSLQLAFNGISRSHFHNGVGYHYALIQPVPIAQGPKAADRPKIQAPYYGAYITNDFIGTEKDTTIVELTQTAANVAGYAVFSQGKPLRALFINYDKYFAGDSAPRSNQQITIAGLKSGSVPRVKRFYAPYTGSLDGLTWGGLSLEAPSGAVTGKQTLERLMTNTLTISASEIIMLTL